MFEAVAGVKFGYILCGIIWSIALGFAAGNYACSLVHRLPRGRLILDKKPYCGTCGTPLQVKDLFPVISGILLRHRCRYCGSPYPVSHTWTEILVGMLFVLAYLEHGFGGPYLLIALIGIFLITLAAIEANEHMIMRSLLLCVIVFGALYRTQMDGNIFDFFLGGLLGGMIGALIWRKQIKPVAHIYALPIQAELMAVGGICVGMNALPLFIALFACVYVMDWMIRKILRSVNPPLITVAFGVAVILPVLYPKLPLLHLL